MDRLREFAFLRLEAGLAGPVETAMGSLTVGEGRSLHAARLAPPAAGCGRLSARQRAKPCRRAVSSQGMATVPEPAPFFGSGVAAKSLQRVGQFGTDQVHVWHTHAGDLGRGVEWPDAAWTAPCPSCPGSGKNVDIAAPRYTLRTVLPPAVDSQMPGSSEGNRPFDRS